MTEKLAVVLVHGAFADGASWSPVVLRLQGAGVDVYVPAVSNRDLAEDAAYVRAFVEHLARPVLLVGHSYGATVAGVAGAAPGVRGIVFVAGYALEEGESASQVHARFPDAPAVVHFDDVAYPELGDGTRRDLSVDPAEFPFLAADGLPADEAGVLAVTQRPLDPAVLVAPAAAAGWRSTPTWGIIATGDRIVNPDALRWAYERTGAREIVEVDGPHLLMHTHPAEVAQVVLRAFAHIA